MKSRPILFSGAMVRAILDGSKTQTRRVVKLTDSGRVKAAGSARNWHLDDPNAVLACPYGQPGDRLYVRETWGIFDAGSKWVENGQPLDSDTEFGVVYKADDHGGKQGECYWKTAPAGSRCWATDEKFHPSIHMPRWASRITLEIVSVRVERLQEISEEDAKAEGVEPIGGGLFQVYQRDPKFPNQVACLAATISYRQLWNSINGPGSWDTNPFVWVVEFRRVQP
jgi:hypothetical protein